MPVHDWTCVEAAVFKDMHHSLIVHISRALNAGLLPAGYYSLIKPHAKFGQQRVSIHHESNHRVKAFIEIVSPIIKERPQNAKTFADTIRAALSFDIHVLVIDLFPPGKHDKLGMHGAIWKALGREKDKPAAEKSLCLMSYVAKMPPEAYLEWLGVGAALPEMPLFLDTKHYVGVPLESTYQTAYRGVPEYWRKFIEQHGKT